MSSSFPRFTDAEIVAARGPRNPVDPARPYAFFVEPERTACGELADVATIFLTNQECPYRCLMCDLWKNTTLTRVPAGAIVAQIDHALERLPAARYLKLYNSGNFFDAGAIPRSDLSAIAERARGFERLIVENHPRLCTDACRAFQDELGCELEIALGLETIHPAALASLNKRMTVADFDQAVQRLQRSGIHTRAFLLLRPPFLDEDESIEWALRTLAHAFGTGVGCCAVIPTRAGNGIMERLEAEGSFTPPALRSLERVMEEGLRAAGGTVLVDLWDAGELPACSRCGPQRIERLGRMNFSQQVEPAIDCSCEEAA